MKAINIIVAGLILGAVFTIASDVRSIRCEIVKAVHCEYVLGLK